MATITKEYIAKLDNKKRFVLRGSNYEYYLVKEYSDGKTILEPRILSEPKKEKRKATIK